jgi:hypothetical protein
MRIPLASDFLFTIVTMNDAFYEIPTTGPSTVNDDSCGISRAIALEPRRVSRCWHDFRLPSWPTRGQSTSVAPAKKMWELAVAQVASASHRGEPP